MASNTQLNFGKKILKELLTGNVEILKATKYYPRWKASLEAGRNSVSDKQPWITFPVIDFLTTHTTPNSKVFEYGGGGSTLFFVKRVNEVVTVEHDPEWFKRLEEIITDESGTNWNGNLILPELKVADKVLDAANPADYYTTDENFLSNVFTKYASFIDRYPNNYFDVVLVDGRSRPSCIFHSLPKIKPGGFLVVDNSDRRYYFKETGKYLDRDFKLVFNKKSPSPYADFFTQTGIWQKR